MTSQPDKLKYLGVNLYTGGIFTRPEPELEWMGRADTHTYGVFKGEIVIRWQDERLFYYEPENPEFVPYTPKTLAENLQWLMDESLTVRSKPPEPRGSSFALETHAVTLADSVDIHLTLSDDALVALVLNLPKDNPDLSDVRQSIEDDLKRARAHISGIPSSDDPLNEQAQDEVIEDKFKQIYQAIKEITDRLTGESDIEKSIRAFAEIIDEDLLGAPQQDVWDHSFDEAAIANALRAVFPSYDEDRITVKKHGNRIADDERYSLTFHGVEPESCLKEFATMLNNGLEKLGRVSYDMETGRATVYNDGRFNDPQTSIYGAIYSINNASPLQADDIIAQLPHSLASLAGRGGVE